MLSNSRIFLEDAFVQFINYGLDVIQEYDVELKLQRSKRRLNQLKNPEAEVSKWVPIKEDVTDMSLRHLSNLKQKVQSNTYYSSFNEKTHFEE